MTSARRGSWPTIELYGGRQRPEDPDAALRVSVVTVVRNGRRHIEEAIRSVLDQDYPNVEYIIVDGGSTDGTLDVVQRYADGITSWITEPDNGVFDAMNKGIARASGQLIKLLNADDVLTSGSSRTAVTLHLASAHPGVIASELDVIDSNGGVLKRLTREDTYPAGPVLHPSWYVDRRVYEQFGLYRTDYRVSSDFEFFLRLHSFGVPVQYASAPLACFRTGGVSDTTLTGLRERYEIMRMYVPLHVAVGSTTVHAYKKVRARILVALLGEKKMYDLRSRIARSSHSRSEK